MSLVARHCEIYELGSGEPRLEDGIRLNEPHITSRNGMHEEIVIAIWICPISWCLLNDGAVPKAIRCYTYTSWALQYEPSQIDSVTPMTNLHQLYRSRFHSYTARK